MKNFYKEIAQFRFIRKILRHLLYKYKNDLVLEIVSNIFCLSKQSQYNLRQQTDFRIPPMQNLYHGRESISCLGPKVWNFNPPDLQLLSFLISFKEAIRNWIPKKALVDFVKFT